MAITNAPIESAKQFAPTPKGKAQRWLIEVETAEENLKKAWKQGDDAVKRYLGEHNEGTRRAVNLFHADVNTYRSLLLGKTPQVDVSRRFSDSEDDAARVAAETEERLLNSDIERDGDGFRPAIKHALEDWTLPGLGQARIRYEVEWGEPIPAVPAKTEVVPETGEVRELAPAVPAQDQKAEEDVATDYVYWRDFIFPPCRTWEECSWVAFRALLTRDEAVKRFPKHGKRLPAKTKPAEDAVEEIKYAWERVEVIELWCKEDRTVRWLCKGYPVLLDERPDPLELESFFPCPRPLLANTTTTKLVPKPDHEFTRSRYDQIEDLDRRIGALIEWARVRGAYDKARAPELGKMLNATEGDMIAVEQWTALGEKGGLESAMAFIPLKDIVGAIEVLSAKRAEAIALLHQETGLSDIVRGQASQRATATEQSIKAQFTSTRLQTAQDEAARFATDLQKLRAEVISKRFDPETIKARSNIERTPDAQHADAAIGVIKDRNGEFRVIVRPEAMALQDMAAQRQERAEAITAVGSHFQNMMPLVELAGAQGPEAVKATLDFVTAGAKWVIAGLRGASDLESAFDRFVEAAQKIAAQPPAPPPPDPRVIATEAKAKADVAKTQLDMQATQLEHRARMEESAADLALTRAKTQGAVIQAAARPAPMAPGEA